MSVSGKGGNEMMCVEVSHKYRSTSRSKWWECYHYRIIVTIVIYLYVITTVIIIA